MGKSSNHWSADGMPAGSMLLSAFSVAALAVGAADDFNPAPAQD